MAIMEFDSALEDTSMGKGLFKYEKYIDFVTEEIEKENVAKDCFSDPKKHGLLAQFFQRANRTIDEISDKQFNLIQLLVEKGYKFEITYFDICAFNNRYCLNGINHDIEEDPFLNTVRILNFLTKKIDISKSIPGDATGYGYPMKLAAEYFNFGFMRSLVKHSYTFEKDHTFKTSPLPKMISTASNEIIERALDECKKLKLPFDIVDEKGNNLIHYAVSIGKPTKVVQMMVEKYGIDPKAENKEGLKPMELKNASVFNKMYLKGVK